MTSEANLTAFLFDNKMKMAHIHEEKQGDLSRISIFQA
jgi:hypothetical protein